MSISILLALRWSGISGILGALMFITADLLYLYIPGSKKSVAEKLSTLSESRLFNSGMLGLFACWLYTLASAHIYFAFQPIGSAFGFVIFLAFAAVMVSYGIGHTAYFSIASGARVAVQLGSNAEMGGKLGSTFFQRLLHIAYIPTAIFSLMMIVGILSGRSLYPRWMVLLMPIVIYLLKNPVVRVLRGHLRELIRDSYDNFTLFVFYVISTIVLWNG